MAKPVISADNSMITYSVTDSSGNIAKVSKKIYYKEKAFKYDLDTYLKDFEELKPPRGDYMLDQFFGVN